MFAVGIISATMLSRYNTIHLGYYSMGDTPIMLILLAINGLTQGVLFKTSEAYGKKDFADCGRTLIQSLKQAVLLSLIAVPIFIFAPYLLSLMGYSLENIRISGNVVRILSIGIPFIVIYVPAQFFLQGIEKPWINSKVAILANVINIFLCWTFINGKLGFEELGAIGVAIAATSTRVFMFLVTLGYIFLSKDCKKFLDFKITKKIVQNREQKMLGYGATANMVSVESSNLFIILFLGYISTTSVAIFTLSYRYLVFMSLIPISLSIASSGFLSQAIGQKNLDMLKSFMKSTFKMNFYITTIICILSFYFSKEISSILNNKEEIINQLTTLIKITSITLFFNSFQSILTINLRAIYDLLIPSIIIFIFSILTVSILCFIWVKDEKDAVIVIFTSNVLTSISLIIRYIYISKRYKFKNNKG